MQRLTMFAWSIWALLAVGCGSGGGSSGTASGGNSAVGGAGGSGGVVATGGGGSGGALPTGVPVLGNGVHSAGAVKTLVIATAADGLEGPRDLEFSKLESGQLWIVNNRGPSVTIVFAAGEPDQSSSTRGAFGAEHFLSKVSALSFGENGFFATAQDEHDVTQKSTPANFMGPTLWTADSGVFDGGVNSHYDMLHNSPDGVGIAWDHDNAYWVFDGYHSAIARCDFHGDHGAGGDDHTDGEVARYVEGEVARVEGIASHLELDHATGLLYIADTGHNRIAVLDTKSGQKGEPILPNYDYDLQYRIDGAKISTLVDGAAAGLGQPSGLALHDGMLFVSDAATARIYAFTLDGKSLDYLETDIAPGGLMGIAFDPQGRLYATDAVADRVLRFGGE